MTTSTQTQSEFPKAKLDEMAQFGREFDRRNSGRWASGVRWNLAALFDGSADPRCDAGADAIYLARQLELIREGVYMARYPELKAKRLVPHTTNVPAGVKQLTVKKMDIAGASKVFSDLTDDAPTVELSVNGVSMTFTNRVLGYRYSDQDAIEAAYAGVPLQTTKAMAVRDIMARELDTFAFIGDAVIAGQGLLNQSSGTTTYATPATGSGGSKGWADKSADQVLLDLNAAGDAIITATIEAEEPDTWLLPLTAHREIANRRVGDGTSATILAYFRDNRDTPVTVERTSKSETLGSGASRRLVVYKNNLKNLEMMVPVEFMQKQPEVRGFNVITNCWMRYGTLAVYTPKTIAYADNI